MCRSFDSVVSQGNSFDQSRNADTLAGLSRQNMKNHLLEPVLSGPEDLRRLLVKLSINNVSGFELEEIFNEGVEYMQTCSLKYEQNTEVTLFSLMRN